MDYLGKELTPMEKAQAQPILDVFANLCLMRGFYRGEEVSFLCSVEQTEAMVEAVPRFILVTDEMAQHCQDPNGRAAEVL